MVTTTNPNLRVHGTVGSIELTGLRKDDAVSLLLQAAGVSRPWDTATEERCAKIADALGYLPLALTQAGDLILKRICDFETFWAFYSKYRRQTRARSMSMDGKACDELMVYSAWEQSMRSLKRRGRESSNDAVQLLNIVSCFHFEHIRVDIFLRALSNKVKDTKDSERSLSAKLRRAITRRLSPPPILPEFLRQEHSSVDHFRVKRALHELESFSIIKYDESGDSFSLNRLVHAWARDRLTQGEQALWAHVALNTLLESVSLSPGGSRVPPAEFHRDILPHLDACLSLCPIKSLDYNSRFRKSKFSLAFAWEYAADLHFRNEATKAAKCGYVLADGGRVRDAVRYLLLVKNVLAEDAEYKNEWTERAMITLTEICHELGSSCLELADSLQGVRITSPTTFRSELTEIILAIDQQDGSRSASSAIPRVS